MATKARIVHGATSEWSTDGTTWASIPEAMAIALPETQVEYQDATSLDSANGFREYVPGLKDAGEISIPCNYTSSAYGDAKGYQENGTLVYFKTTLPIETGQSTADVFEFKGFVNPQIGVTNAPDKMEMTINVRTSGGVTFTEGTAA